MKQKHLTILVLVFALVAMPGCIYMLFGEPDTARPEVKLSPPPLPQTGDFNYSGEVGIYGVGEACVRDVRVILYDDNLTKIDEHAVGDLCLHNTSTKPLNISMSTQPSYIVIRSPDVYGEDSPADAVGLARNTSNGFYDMYLLTDPDQIRPPNTTTETESNRIKPNALQPRDRLRYLSAPTTTTQQFRGTDANRAEIQA